MSEPMILGHEEQRERCEAVVARANPPPVVVEESERAKMLRDLKAQQGNVEPEARPERDGV